MYLFDNTHDHVGPAITNLFEKSAHRIYVSIDENSAQPQIQRYVCGTSSQVQGGISHQQDEVIYVSIDEDSMGARKGGAAPRDPWARRCWA